jgi:hypothetical protein
VSKAVDSQALVGLNRILGLAGAGSTETFLEDGLLQQTFDIQHVVRRSRTQAGSAGWFYAVFQNTHSGAVGRTSAINPYATTATQALNAWQAPVEAGFDVWLMYATMQRASGGGLNAGMCLLSPAANMQCFGIQNDGSGVEESPDIPVAFWDSVDSVTGEDFGLTESGEMCVDIKKRIRRGTNVLFNTDSAATAVFRMTAVFGLFPAGMGQDIVG